tara:strand:- start:347 stop:592 length:246 start_codon:yes stop_codon:yes gene_type:complete
MNDDQYTITKQRLDILDMLKAKLAQAKKRIEVLEVKIEKKGIDAGYSINEDLLEISKRIWMYSNELAMLKKINKLRTNESR